MTIEIEALPLPSEVTNLLDSNDKLLQALDHHLSQSIGGHTTKYDRLTALSEPSLVQLKALRRQIEQLLIDLDGWKSLACRIWSFGPRKYGPNLLVNGVQEYHRRSVWDMLDITDESQCLRDFDSSIVNGFQLATLTGPMCEEPMRGVAFVVRRWDLLSLPVSNPLGLLLCICYI